MSLHSCNEAPSALVQSPHQVPDKPALKRLATPVGRRPASRLAVGLWAAGLLAGCGGGGGGDAPVPLEVPMGLRVEAASAGSDLTASALSTQGAALAQAVMFTTGNPLASAAFSLQAAPVAMLATAGGDLLRQALAPRGQGGPRPLGVETVREACLVSGSMSLSAHDADENGMLSLGDSMTLMASACVTAPDAPALDGVLGMTVERLELDGSGWVNALEASGTLVGFGVGASATMDGGFHLWMRNGAGSVASASAAQQMRMRYQDMLVRRNGQGTLIFDFDVLTVASSVEARHTLSGGLVIDGLTYQLEPVDGAPLSLSLTGGLPGSFYEPARDVWPRAGALRLRDAAGDALLLRARPEGVLDLEFTPAGALAPTATLPGQPWGRFLQGPG